MPDENAKPEPQRRSFVGLITDRWIVSAIGAFAFALIVWFLGPFFPFLVDALPRVLLVAIVVLVWLITNLLLDMRATRRNADMIAKVTEGAPARALSAADRDAAEEMNVLRQRLEEALLQLRKSQASSKKKRQYLYELPWYILIGPPGSGKTTALLNSGLKFPLSDKFGKDPLRGVGGTRNCDWWFSDDAILLDTAGRYTTQDSNAAVDQKAWRGFLGLLKEFRPRQPINGVVVAIGLPDLLGMTQAARSAHARAIKDRLAELQREFGVRLPVYAVLTKADLLAGFVEFFGDLDREGRANVWGATFTLDDGKANSTPAFASFDSEFDALLQRLNERLLERISEERDPERRARLFGFPMQFALLKPMLHEFLGEVFAPNRFEDRPFLRGAYFTSATQQGTPMDRLMTAMVGAFGLTDQKPPAFSGAGRSYFVTRLLREVIFGEASLVGANPKVERRNRLMHYGALAGMAAMALILIGGWTMSYFGNRALIADQASAAGAYRALATPIAYDTTVQPPVQRVVLDDNVAAVMRALDELRGFPAGYDSAEARVPLSRRFGLNYNPKLQQPSINAYRRALHGLLLPRLLVGLQSQLGNFISAPDYVSVFLPTYLMLGGNIPLDRDFAKPVILSLWGTRAYTDLSADEGRQLFERHIDALLEEQLPVAQLDGELLTRARRVYANTPIPVRAYNAIKNSQAALALPPWRVVDHAGPAAAQVFTRTSGKLLADGIPGFFTYNGFQTVLLPRIPGAVTAAANEAKSVTETAVTLNPGALRALIDDTTNLYARDFILTWDQLLADVTVRPFRNNAEAADVLGTLSGPSSPLKPFLRAVAGETKMNRPAAGAAIDAAKSTTAGQALGAIGQVTGLTPAAPGQAIDQHFLPLHQFVAGAETGQSQLDNLIRQLAELYMQMNNQPGAPTGLPSGGTVNTLSAQISRLPPPLNRMISQVTGGSTNLAAGAARTTLQGLYTSTVLPFCRQALDGRYPLVNTGPNDVTPGDFQQMFRPGGTIDAFFANNLRPFVDTTTSPWRSQRAELGLSPAALTQFERAQRIRDSFFPAGGAALMTEFTLTPIDLSPNAREVVFDADGQQLTFSRGPVVPQRMQWPAPNGVGRARLVFTRTDRQTEAIEATGPWALFRLLDRATVGGNLPDQLTVGFNVNGLTANFQLRAASVRNPFRTREQFQCPAQL